MAAVELRREFVEELQRQAQQPKLNAAAKRLELRRVKEQLEVDRGEKARLNSLAIVEQDRELWRLQDNKHCEQKRLRDEAGLRARGAFKRPVAGQQPTKPLAKRRLVGVEDRRSRYS